MRFFMEIFKNGTSINFENKQERRAFLARQIERKRERERDVFISSNSLSQKRLLCPFEMSFLGATERLFFQFIH